jgi:hypothetical protein
LQNKPNPSLAVNNIPQKKPNPKPKGFNPWLTRK